MAPLEGVRPNKNDCDKVKAFVSLCKRNSCQGKQWVIFRTVKVKHLLHWKEHFAHLLLIFFWQEILKCLEVGYKTPKLIMILDSCWGAFLTWRLTCGCGVPKILWHNVNSQLKPKFTGVQSICAHSPQDTKEVCSSHSASLTVALFVWQSTQH